MTVETGLDLSKYHAGVVHIHSHYSHDGHGTIGDMGATLKASGIDFCILTDHFEDFDDDKFRRYVAEIESVNRLQKTVFVPAIEAEFEGFHVIFFPVSEYAEIRTIVDRRDFRDSSLVKILAHPSKHPLADVVTFLRRHRVDGVEIWNQQADSRYLPPAQCFVDLMALLPGDKPAIVFGSDIHNFAKHSVSNLLLIERNGSLNGAHIIEKLRKREHLNFSLALKQHLRGNADPLSVTAWFEGLKGKAKKKAFVLQSTKRTLRFVYHLLPRTIQHNINDVKNTVKNWL